MARKIIGGVFIVIVLLVAIYWYRNWKAQGNIGSGDVYPETPTRSSGEYSAPNSAASPNVPAPSTTSNQPPGGAPPPAQNSTTAQPAGAPPANDTVSSNPPNGMVFTGSGRYQWYRQGNLTWRVDTQNGATCIAFATDEEWRKPRVYQNGCGTH